MAFNNRERGEVDHFFDHVESPAERVSGLSHRDETDSDAPTYDVPLCFLSAAERSDFGMWQQQQLESDRHRVWCERFCDDRGAAAERALSVQRAEVRRTALQSTDWSELRFPGLEPH